MNYDSLSKKEKQKFVRMNGVFGFSELYSHCISRLAMMNGYVCTRADLVWFMKKSGIESDFSVPTKRTLLLCLIAMDRMTDVPEPTFEQTRNYLETCFSLPSA